MLIETMSTGLLANLDTVRFPTTASRTLHYRMDERNGVKRRKIGIIESEVDLSDVLQASGFMKRHFLQSEHC